jgi:hypothetical protein
MENHAVIALYNAKVELVKCIAHHQDMVIVRQLATCKRSHAANTLAPDLRVQQPRNWPLR